MQIKYVYLMIPKQEKSVGLKKSHCRSLICFIYKGLHCLTKSHHLAVNSRTVLTHFQLRTVLNAVEDTN